jgi:pheromone shutdown protein TraB
MEYKNLTIIGTSHISQESVDIIKASFKKIEPDIVAIELDNMRLYALLNDAKPSYRLSSIKDIGLQGYLFALIGSVIQKKLGSIVKLNPGEDMLTAAKLAIDNKIPIALIDQDIRITLKKFSKEFSWREKLNLVADFFKGIFFPNKINIDLSKVPSHQLIETAMRHLKDRYPHLYKVLVLERNQIMSRKLFVIMHKNHEKKIIAVVGAGHEREILEMVKQRELQLHKHDFV